MKPPPFAYVRVDSVGAAVAALAAHGPEARLLAGGQSLLPAMNLRWIRPSVLIDLEHVVELSAITPIEGGLDLGAMVRQGDAERSPAVRDGAPLVAAALRNVGYAQVRTRGTIGGSLAHADPAGELPAVALLLDATLQAEGTSGTRSIPAREFFQAPFRTALRSDEVLTRIRLESPNVDAWAFEEVARRGRERALAGLAGLRRGAEVRLVAFGRSGGPIRLRGAEAAVSGGRLDPATIGAAARAGRDDISAAFGSAPDSAYRALATAGLARRVLEALAA